MVAELNHILKMIDNSLESVKSPPGAANPDSAERQAVIENLRLLQRFGRAYQAVLPQIGVLGAENADRIIHLYFGLELLVEEARLVEYVMETVNYSQFLLCVGHAKKVREKTDEVGLSLTQQFLTSELEAARRPQSK